MFCKRENKKRTKQTNHLCCSVLWSSWRQWTKLYSSNTHKQFNTLSSENTLAVQWVGPHDLTAKDAGSIPGWEISANRSAWQKKKCPPILMKASSTVVQHSPSLLQTPASQRHQIWFHYLYPKTHPYALVRHGSFHLNLIFLSISPVSKDKRVKWRYS